VIKLDQTLTGGGGKDHLTPVRSVSYTFSFAKTLDNKSLAILGDKFFSPQRGLTINSPMSVCSGGKISQTENMKSVAAESTLKEQAIEIRSLL